MINRGHFWNRGHWRELIWKRPWELEDVFWCLKSRCHRSLDMLSEICSTTRWQLADRFSDIISNCEVMVKIICHVSLLKVDDVRLKSLPISKCCTLCDHGSLDDAAHMVMQCPRYSHSVVLCSLR